MFVELGAPGRFNAQLQHSPSELASAFHYGKGWERFTDAVVQVLLEREDPVIFLLWGKSAQEKMCAYFREQKKSPRLF